MTLVSLICFTLLIPCATAQDKPRLRVETKRAEWGELIQGDTKKVSFTLMNDGDADLEIVRATPTCGCLSVEVPAGKIAPGTSKTLEVRVDTGRLPGGETTKMVLLVTNDRRAGQLALEVHGRVIALLSQSPEDLVARVFPGEKPRLEAELTAATDRVAALISARAKDPRFRTGLEPNDRAGGRLTIEGPSEDGPRHVGLEIEIEVRMTDGTTRTTKARCRVEYRSRWELSSRRQVSFSRQETSQWEKNTAEPLTKTIDVHAVAPDFTMMLKSVRVTGVPDGWLECRAHTVAAGKHYRLELRLLKPVEQRILRGQLIVRTDDPKTPELKLRVLAYPGR